MSVTRRWQKKYVKLLRLAEAIEQYCKNNGFATRISKRDGFYHIQALKAGLIRSIVGARRCLDIIIQGTAGDFEVSVSTGEWGKNIFASVVTGALTLGAGLLSAGASVAAYKYFEERLWNFINAQISALKNSDSEPTLLCPNCNKQISLDFKLCPYCGFNLK
jgi:hypothetical protein